MNKPEIKAEPVKIDFIKKPIDEIFEDSKSIDVEKAAKEILQWVTDNVENFIDNQKKMFKLDLVLEDNKNVIEVKKLQDLYRAIPDDEELSKKDIEKAVKCRRILDKITEKVYKSITESKEQQDKLFKRMIFYYERVIPNSENKKRAEEIDKQLRGLVTNQDGILNKAQIQEEINKLIEEGKQLVKFEELEGDVNITKFEYEAFSIGVSIRKTNDKGEKEVVKSYEVPEGLTLWLELNYRPKQRMVSIF